MVVLIGQHALILIQIADTASPFSSWHLKYDKALVYLNLCVIEREREIERESLITDILDSSN